MELDFDDLDLGDFSTSERVVLEEYIRRKRLQVKGQSFLDFVLHVYPDFVVEEIHVLIARHFEQLRAGEIDRLLISMPPRAGKSLMSSQLLPAWWMGQFPKDQILHTSYASALVDKFGRYIRNMLISNDYKQVFPATIVAKDSRAANQWSTTVGGVYNAIGAGGGAAGRGANLLLADDVVSEQDMHSATVHSNIWDWWQSGMYTRRMPDRNAMVVVATRWRVDDLIGRLLAESATTPGADQWTYLKVPAIVDEATAALLNTCSSDPRVKEPKFYVPGDSFSPRRWPLSELQRTKVAVGRKAWSSLYLQSPVAEGGGIIMSDWWKPYDTEKSLPKFDYIIQSYDTAFEEGESNDFSARTTLGVFKRASDNRMCLMVLERMKERMSFPKLLTDALESFREYKPDRVVIEKAASGIPLIQEMKKRGIPVAPIKPQGSKIARANAAAIAFEQGVVYYPKGKRWAQDLIDEVASFPDGDHDDSTDSLVYGVNYARRMFLLQTPEDMEDEDDDAEPGQKRSYAVRRARIGTSATA